MSGVKFLLFLIIFAVSIMNLGCRESYVPMKIEGTAMLPNFKEGDRIIVGNNTSEIKRGDVIFFQYPKDMTKLYLKRVVGLPNETVSIIEGNVFVNGEKIKESYADQNYNQSKVSFPPKLIPEHSYYVLGDNRDNSSDSRYWGTVKEELIVGKYWLTYWKSK